MDSNGFYCMSLSSSLSSKAIVAEEQRAYLCSASHTHVATAPGVRVLPCAYAGQFYNIRTSRIDRGYIKCPFFVCRDGCSLKRLSYLLHTRMYMSRVLDVQFTSSLRLPRGSVTASCESRCLGVVVCHCAILTQVASQWLYLFSRSLFSINTTIRNPPSNLSPF
jgi:hypothetical protein